MEVYYFEQTIPWTKVPFPKKMPIEGIDAPTMSTQTGTTRWYTTRRMFWVDPVTGAPVNGEEIHQEELRGGILLGGRDEGDRLRRAREDARGLHRLHRRPGQVPTVRWSCCMTLVPALGASCSWASLLLALALVLEARGRRPADPPRTDGPASRSRSAA